MPSLPAASTRVRVKRQELSVDQFDVITETIHPPAATVVVTMTSTMTYATTPTSDSSLSNSSSKQPTGALIGGVIGALITIILIVVLVAVHLVRKRRRKLAVPDSAPTYNMGDKWSLNPEQKTWDQGRSSFGVVSQESSGNRVR